MLPVAIAAVAVAGTLAGLGVALAGGPSGGSSEGSESVLSPLPVRSSSPANGTVLPGFTSPDAHFAVPSADLASEHAVQAVAPLRRLLQADLLIVSKSSLAPGVLAAVMHRHGVAAADQVDAVRMEINGGYTAVLGVNPSAFRGYAAGPTARSDALWNGVANGGIAISYTMGKMDKLPLGGTVLAAGATTKKLRIVAFGTMGIGGVDGVVSTSVARSLGMPSGNAIVISAPRANLTSLARALARVVPRGASIQPLVTEVTAGGSVSAGGTATGNGYGLTGAQTLAMLRAAESRLGMPYVWGGDGPTTFDCSGLVQWSFRQAGIVMPRVAADQALTGPAVPVSKLVPGDLLFYHTDPTAPDYISHVAIYLGSGDMLQAPETGMDVEVVPADFGPEFAGAVQVYPSVAASVAAQFS